MGRYKFELTYYIERERERDRERERAERERESRESAERE
jgi:hypothetical protein